MQCSHLNYYEEGATITIEMFSNQEAWLENLQPYIQKAQKGECHLLFSEPAHFTVSSSAVWYNLPATYS